MDEILVLLRKLYRGIGTTRSKKLASWAERGEWTLLLRERAEAPGKYGSADAYFRDVLACDFVRKLNVPGNADARRQKAIDTFFKSEEACCATNARLTRFLGYQGPFGPSDMRVIDLIDRWRKEIRIVMGRVPDDLMPTFSGGSTLSDKGMMVTIPDKMSSNLTLYQGSRDIVAHCFRGIGVYQPHLGEEVRANHFFTVPKDWDKDRGCCVEASSAVMLQLAVHKLLTRRYEKRYEVNTARLPEYHQWLAAIASKTGAFATIDLSNASDTVSKQLVKLLLPAPWFELLDSLRAKFTELDGKMYRLEKFSSMGNGFTFVLETILFQTLCRALGSLNSTCVGDDIIVETEYAGDVIAALRFFGFTPNEKKTFCEGPFRESCGGDFFNGQAVRPAFLKELPDEPQHWVSIANRLRRADPSMRYVRAAWRYAVDRLPSSWRVFSSDETLGDLAVFDPTAQPIMKKHFSPDRRGRGEGHYHPTWVVMMPIHKRIPLTFFDHHVHLVARAAGFCGATVSPRDSVIGYKRGYVSAIGSSWSPN